MAFQSFENFESHHDPCLDSADGVGMSTDVAPASRFPVHTATAPPRPPPPPLGQPYGTQLNQGLIATAEQVNRSGIIQTHVPFGQDQWSGFSRSPVSSPPFPQTLNSNPHVFYGGVFDRGMEGATTDQSGIAVTNNNNVGAGMYGTSRVHERNYSQPDGELAISVSSQRLHQIRKLTVHSVPASGPFLCGWESCNSRGPFAQKSSLWRHIQTKHIPNDWHLCALCRRAFNRKDKVLEHIRFAHGLNQRP
ncbi:unnamed protein product [Penicillium manginii]